MNKFFWNGFCFVAIIVALIIYACANRGYPQGGEKDVKDGIIAPVTMEELLGEIILTDYSAFALMPMVSFVYGDDVEKIDAFLRRQREKAVQRMRDFLRPRQ